MDKKWTQRRGYSAGIGRSGVRDTAVEICRKHWISQQTFYMRKKKYAGLGLNELRELRQLREENAKLKRLVADVSLDRHILQEIIGKNCKASCVAQLITVDRMTLCYLHHRDPQEALSVRLRELTGCRVRYGSRV